MKKLKYDDPSLRPPKAMMQLVDAFTDNYSPVMREEDAGVIFTVAKLREYFNAWPAPKMPDPLPPYLNELERRGFASPPCSACGTIRYGIRAGKE